VLLLLLIYQGVEGISILSTNKKPFQPLEELSPLTIRKPTVKGYKVPTVWRTPTCCYLLCFSLLTFWPIAYPINLMNKLI